MLKMERISFILLISLVSMFACHREKFRALQEESLFSLVPAGESGVDFTNTIVNEKDLNIFLYRNFYNGGGVGIGDINNDSLPDIYLIGNMVENRLFLNLGDLRFRDITESSGTGGSHAWSTGLVMVDINADGLLDIYVCNAGNVHGDDPENELFLNNGDLSFTDRAEEYGLADDGFTTHAAFFDYDMDGDLDVYILNNSFIPVNSLAYSNERMVRSQHWDVPDLVKGGGDKLMRNDKGRFTDVSEEAGIWGSLIGFGMGVTVGDVNNDRRPDIYISNDFYERDYLYLNRGDATFYEDIQNRMAHLSLASMGADMADINNDGYSEIYVTDMLPEGDARLKETTDLDGYDIYKFKLMDGFYHQFTQNTLQLNRGDGSFSDIAYYSGVAETDWSWGPLIFDMDNDGFQDIFVANGIYQDLTNQDFIDFFASRVIQQMVISGEKEAVDSIISKMPSTPIANYAYWNRGNLKFVNKSRDWGLDTPSFSNGSSYGDLDNDGDLDLVVNNVNMPCFIYENRSTEKNGNHFLKVRLEGGGENSFGIGSVVYAYAGGRLHKQELIPSRGFQSSVSPVLHFGLGAEAKVDSLVVLWPGQEKQVLSDLEVDRLIVLKISEAEWTPPVDPRPEPEVLREKDSPFEPHRENDYVDFNYEGLIWEMLSREGPAMDVADINGDGLDDVFIGGATNYAGKLYIQSADGHMQSRENSCFAEDRMYEDTYVLFLDVDGDGDQDLYVGSGGNDKHENSPLLRDRLYLNMGMGRFEPSREAIPDFRYNTSVVAPCDFDRDGDQDLFVGSLSVSRMYGINPKHCLLENKGSGSFLDITESRAYDLRRLGMLSDAVWEDMDGDGMQDLLCVGQWMAPVVFRNSGRRLSRMESSLDTLNGWWNAVALADLDGDGDRDLVLGNRGLNSHIRPGRNCPVKLFVNDFDNNGTIEQIATRFTEGKDKPISLKREISMQIPFLDNEHLSFLEYAGKSIHELFPEDVLANSIVREVSMAESILAFNEGNMVFRVEALPRDIQLSSVNTIHVSDLNQDGWADLVLGENSLNMKPQFGRMDAGFAQVLMGSDSGFDPPRRIGRPGLGEVKSIRELSIQGRRHLILGVNNDKVRLYEISP
jgi:hypothetical protein